MNSCVQQSIILFMLFFASTTVVFPMFFRFSSDDNTIIIPLYYHKILYYDGKIMVTYMYFNRFILPPRTKKVKSQSLRFAIARVFSQ